MKNKLLLLTIFILSLSFLAESLSIRQNKWKYKKVSCPDPYQKCNLGKDGMINVHIVPHTHDDVGWLKTVDQYYYGSNTGQQKASVQYILDTVVSELAKDPNKRFVYVEIAYFYRWWNEQNDETKQLVRVLVDERRLEFVIGAWCMNDEASTYYQDIIDQQTLGLQFILNEFGECARPRTAWQVDPFGHSREQASLFAQFGFDGLFLGRLDYQDNYFRSINKTREMVWHASSSLGEKAKIFTGILPNHYSPPGGFCFDEYCRDDPIMDNPNLEDYNVDKKLDAFVSAVLNEANSYKTKNLIMTMGDDFQYSNAHMNFKNLDKLIYYMNKRQSNGSQINIFYSTPSCYLYSLYKSNVTWPTKNDDFFPYASRAHTFWTGYFTSRTALKYYVRQTNGFLQAVRQFAAIAQLFDDNTKALFGILNRAMGVLQHHDAVSGTERQHVANDYAKRLSVGTDRGLDILNSAFSNQYVSEKLSESSIFYCPLLNISECQPLETLTFLIFAYNPLGQSINKYFRIPLIGTQYKVMDQYLANEIPVEFVPIPDEIKNLPERKSQADYEMVFNSTLPPIGFGYFFVIPLFNSQMETTKVPNISKNINDNFTIQNEFLTLHFDSKSNLLQIDNMNTGIKSKLFQKFCYYMSAVGDNSNPDLQASGAYIFRPNGSDTCMIPSEYVVLTGYQYQEVRQVYNKYISQRIRLYKGVKHVEFEWEVGPIDVDDKVGKEVVVKFLSDLNSDATFYTDSNGREILKRVRDYRPSWPHFNQTEPVAGNYYPINSRIFIRDEHGSGPLRQFTVVTDRTHGGASIKDGSVEIMLHRRILHDDSLGVSEPLNEPGTDNKGLISIGKLYVFFDTTENSVKLHRKAAHEVNTPPLILFIHAETFENSFSNIYMNHRYNSFELPENIHLLTFMYDFDNLNGHALLVRFEHFYEIGEDAILSKPATFNLHDLFGDYFKLLGLQELTLGANMDISELKNRLNFNENTKTQYKQPNLTNDFDVTLNPMEIRTFRLFFEPKPKF